MSSLEKPPLYILLIRLARIDKPIGTLLLLWPTLTALWIAKSAIPDFILITIFTIGTFLMRSAGCVINDVFDRKYDCHVARTKLRPLTSGQLSLKTALIFFFCLLICSFLIILPILNLQFFILSLIALMVAVSYPLTKRFLALPQAYLGVAFGFGIPMAFSSILHQLPNLAWYLLLANIFWALAYDTEYAMVDRADDLKIGIKTSAITFAKYDVMAIMICYSAYLLINLLIAKELFVNNTAFYFFIIFWTFALMVVIYHYQLIKNRMPEQCFKAFLHNNYLGMLIFFAYFVAFLFN